MGLEEFMDIDSDSNNKTESNDSKEQITDNPGITKYEDGDVGPRGPYGYEKIDDYEKTIVGDIDTHGDMFKYHMPIFPHIEIEDCYTVGDRYGGIEGHKGTSCVSNRETQLVRVNREIIMIDTGGTSKEKCLDVLEDRFGRDVTPNTVVHLYFFAKTRHLVKLALGDEMTERIGAHGKENILKAVFGESWTHTFREYDEKEGNKLTHHIEEW